VESFIINPLAYRVLLIDFDTWRKSAPITQELYYKQFVTFAVNSKFHEFNSRRLQRMRKDWRTQADESQHADDLPTGIVKRLLDALKAETMSENVMPHFLDAFESLIKCNFNAEAHRTIALFITYTFHSSANSQPRTPRPMSAITPTNGRRRATVDSASGANMPVLTRKQVGVKILALYTRLLCDKGNFTDIHKFARTVTNKVSRNASSLIFDADMDTLVASVPTCRGESRSHRLWLQNHRQSARVTWVKLCFQICQEDGRVRNHVPPFEALVGYSNSVANVSQYTFWG